MMHQINDRKKSAIRWITIATVGLVLFVVAPLVLPEFRLNLLAKFLTFAIVAMGLDLAWGYTGTLSLGHGVFFGLGAYAMAMYLKLEAVDGALPDFMAWSGLRDLPLFWIPFGNPFFAVAMVVILPTALAALLGYLVFRSRIQGAYFSIITQALALIVTILFIGQQPYTGGTNGITNYSTIFGFPLSDSKVQHVLYLITVACLGATYFSTYWLTHSRFGRLLVAVRDDENRVRFCGYDPVKIKVLIFALSAALSGIGGALFVPQVGIISPSMMGIIPSIEMAVWVAVGGRGTLVGPILGAVLVNAAKSGLSESFPDIWLLFLGGLFIGVVLLFPDGVIGSLRRISEWCRSRTAGPEDRSSLSHQLLDTEERLVKVR